MWGVTVTDLSGNTKAVFEPHELTHTRRLNAHSSVGFKLHINDPATPELLIAERAVKVYRDGVLRFYGKISEPLGDDQNFTTVVAHDPFFFLALREVIVPIGPLGPGGAGAPAWSYIELLLDQQNDRSPIRLTLPPALGVGPSIVRAFVAGDKVGERILQMAEADDGFYFVVQPVDGVPGTFGALEVRYPLPGDEKHGARFEYGEGTIGNLSGYRREQRLPRNRIMATGATEGEFVARVGVQDNTSISRFDLMEDTISVPDVFDEPTLVAAAGGVITPTPPTVYDAQILDRESVAANNVFVPSLYDDFDVGDEVSLLVRRGERTSRVDQVEPTLIVTGAEVSDGERDHPNFVAVTGDGRPYGYRLVDARPSHIPLSGQPPTWPMGPEYNTGNPLSNQLAVVNGGLYGWPNELWFEGIVRSTDDVGAGGLTGRMLLSMPGHPGTGQHAAGEEYWEKFFVYFPTDFVTSPSGVGGVDEEHNLYFEHHHTGSVFQEQANVHLGLHHYADGRSPTFHAKITGGTNNGVDASGYTIARRGEFYGTPAPYEFVRQSRYDFKLHTIDSVTTGLFEVWMSKDGAPFLPWFSYAGPTLYTGGAAGGSEYVELGWYRKAYSQTTRVLFGGYQAAASEEELYPQGTGDGSFGIYEAVTNKVPDPSAEGALTGWAPFSGYSLAASTLHHKFGTKSAKISWQSGANGTMLEIPVTFTSAGVKTISLWMLVPSEWEGGIPNLGTSGFVGSTGGDLRLFDMAPVRDEWHHYSFQFTVDAGDLSGNIVLNRGGGAAPTTPGNGLYLDGVQAADGPVELPFSLPPVRPLSRVQVPNHVEDVTLLNPQVGAIVIRQIMGYGSADLGGGGSPVSFGILLDANNEMHVYYDGANLRWQFRRLGAGTSSDAVSSKTFKKSARQTLVIGWDLTGTKISVNGAAPGTSGTANPLVGDVLNSFDIGTLFGSVVSVSNGWFPWAVTLKKYPTNANDLAVYAALGRDISLDDMPTPGDVTGIIPFNDQIFEEYPPQTNVVSIPPVVHIDANPRIAEATVQVSDATGAEQLAAVLMMNKES